MTRRWTRRVGIALAGIILVGASKPAAMTIGAVAPPFQLTLIDGSTVTSDQLRGQVVVLNFWATWCVPCREELPLLDGYFAAQKRHGLQVYAIATEGSLPVGRLRRLFAVMRMAPARRIRGDYDIIGGLPTNYIIDRAGRIRYARAGAFTLDTLNEALIPLLKEAPPAD